MKFSEQWLREWVNPAITTDELTAKLTMAGLEVDAVEAAAAVFSGVLIGEIISVEPHPDAQKLQVCRVNGHADGPMQVVCGAPNARAGLKVPFATVGAKLPGDLNIKKAKLRGVESFGMLCGQTELELGDDDSGLWELPDDAPVGVDLGTWLNLHDNLIEVDLTPNRSDCLSIRGLAREVAVLTDNDFVDLGVTEVAANCNSELNIVVDDPQACPAYAGRVIRGVDLNRPSPLWLTEKLRRSGVRSIDPVVDVTNYVMLELGQPMHAFDLAKLDGGITVRRAVKGEKIELLNEQTVELREDTLVISDDHRSLAIAGVMGGRASAVSVQTRDIFLESAFFAPRHISGTARSYGLHTDSSHRYERGVDFQLYRKALERASALLAEIVGGKAGPIVVCEHLELLPERRPVKLSAERIRSRLSIDPQELNVPLMMERLGLSLLEQSEDGWVFAVPSYRFDIEIEEDLLEEVARIYGYDNVPSRALQFSSELEDHSEAVTPLSLLKDTLCARGYQEIITYSFIDPKIHHKLFASAEAIVLRNPISADMANMRTSLLPGLVSTLISNLNRQQNRVKLFETGMVFLPAANAGESIQATRVGGLCFGTVREVSWAEQSRTIDFFDIKGDLQSMLSICAKGRTLTFEPSADYDHMHPGQSANIMLDGEPVGYLGALHPLKCTDLGLSKSVWVFECDLPPLLQSTVPAFTPMSRYPEVTRDLAVVINKAVCVADLELSMRNVAGDALKELKLFDVYSGEGIDPKGKSLAFSFTFQRLDRTLTDEEVNAFMASILACLQDQHGATLR